MNELRNLLQTKSLDALQVIGIPDDERSAVNTLYSSLSVSVDHLRKMNPEVIQFFSIMALLPAGARVQDFDGNSSTHRLIALSDWVSGVGG